MFRFRFYRDIGVHPLRSTQMNSTRYSSGLSSASRSALPNLGQVSTPRRAVFILLHTLLHTVVLVPPIYDFVVYCLSVMHSSLVHCTCYFCTHTHTHTPKLSMPWSPLTSMSVLLGRYLLVFLMLFCKHICDLMSTTHCLR